MHISAEEDWEEHMFIWQSLWEHAQSRWQDRADGLNRSRFHKAYVRVYK